MTTRKLTRAAANAALAACLGLAATAPVEAAFIFDVQEQSSSVVITGSGTIDTTGLTRGAVSTTLIGIIVPSGGELYQVDLASYASWTGLTGPDSFGSGGSRSTAAHGGDSVGIQGFFATLILPGDYSPGARLAADLIYPDDTFATLGLTPGTYVWSWPGDTLTVQIGERPGPEVPEPGSALLIGASVIGLAATRSCRKRRAGPRPRARGETEVQRGQEPTT